MNAKWWCVTALMVWLTGGLNSNGAAIHDAAQRGDLAAVQALLKQDPQLITAKDAEGNPPLHRAAGAGRSPVIEWLLAAGAPVNGRGNQDATALHLAARYGHTTSVKILLAHQTEVDARSNEDVTPFHLAAYYGHRDTAALLLEHGAAIEARNVEGFTALLGAVNNGHQEVVRFLLAKGADIHGHSTNGSAPLHVAVVNGHQELVTLLLDEGANVNAQKADGDTALHLAAAKGQSDLAKLLLARKAEVNATNHTGVTPLMVAAVTGHETFAKALLEHGADPNRSNQAEPPLLVAAYHGHRGIVALLLDRKADPNALSREGESALHAAALKGDLAMCRLLLEHGADVRASLDDHGGPLHIAALQGHTAVTELLLQHGAPVNAPGYRGVTPLLAAALGGHTKTVGALLDHQADTEARDELGRTALLCAAGKGHWETAELLLTRGAKVDAVGKDGSTALHAAAIAGAREMMELLLDHGAPVDAKDADGWPPLVFAVAKGDLDAVAILLAHEADPNLRFGNGSTALHLAAGKENSALVERLLQHRANPNGTNDAGATPLHLAAEHGHAATAKALLAGGADPQAKTKAGHRPYDVAQARGHDQLVRLLQPPTAPGDPKAEPAVVGALGDVDRIDFAGNPTFPATRIREGLRRSPDFLIAAHPWAPWREFLDTLPRKLREGYQHAGFPEATVSVQFDAQREQLHVHVAEGPRFRKGAVRVVGARTLPVADFIRRLTRPWPPPGVERIDKEGKPIEPEDPIWTAGKPAPFDELWRQFMLIRLRPILSEFGLYFPQFDLRVVPQADAGLADWIIEIQDEGPPGTVADIEVAGNDKNSREAVLQFLECSPGMEVNRERIERMGHKLWQSARFLDYSIQPEAINTNDPTAAQLKLKVQLREYSQAPPLNEPLTPEQVAMLKLRDWMANAADRGDDMVLQISGQPDFRSKGLALEFVFSPRHGFMWLLRDADTPPATANAAFMAGDEGWGIYVPVRSRKLEVRVQPGWQVTAFAHVVPDPKSEDEQSMVTFGAGFKSKGARTPDNTAVVPFALSTRLAPVTFLREVCRNREQWKLDADTLSIEHEGVSARIHAASGRLETLTFTDKEVQGSVHFERDAFGKRWQQLQRDTASLTNLHDPAHLFASLVAYLALEVAPGGLADWLLRPETEPSFNGEATGAWLSLYAAAAEALGRSFSSADANEADEFTIPNDQMADPSTGMAGLLSELAAAIFRVSCDLVPPGSWPWTVAHEAVFVVRNQGRYTGKELERLFASKETGPVGCLAIAKLLSLIGSPHASAFAARGLGRLTAADFRQDWQLLVAGKPALRQAFESAAAALRDLPDAQLKALEAPYGPWLRRAAQMLQDRRDQPLADVLAPVFDEFWHSVLQEKMATALKPLTR